MAYAKTTAYHVIKDCFMHHFWSVCQGGTSAGKTIAILLLMTGYLQSNEGKLVSVVTQTAPQMERGPWRDFFNIIKAQGLVEFFDINRTTRILTYRPTGSSIEFFALDDELKARGARRDVLFVNEANRISWSAFDQLAVRTRERVIIDFNPSQRFWAHTKLRELAGGDYGFCQLTYLDNEALSPRIIESIESHRSNPEWWRVYGEGNIGELTSGVYRGWKRYDGDFMDAELVGYGVDFGFDPDPTAVVALYTHGGGVLFRQLLERARMTSSDIVAWCQANTEHGYPLVCDNARPEIIADMAREGLQAFGAIKTERINGDVAGRLNQIDLLSQQAPVFYTGEDMEREYLSYTHVERHGVITTDVADGNDHLMDASRYVWYWHWRKRRIADEVAAAYGDEAPQTMDDIASGLEYDEERHHLR